MSQILTVRQVTEHYPAFTENALRWRLFNKEKNGLVSAVLKVGGRVYIDTDKFDRWLDSQRCGSSVGMGG